MRVVDLQLFERCWIEWINTKWYRSVYGSANGPRIVFNVSFNLPRYTGLKNQNILTNLLEIFLKIPTLGVLLACDYAQRFPWVVRERRFNRDRRRLDIDRKTISSVIFRPCTFSFTASCAWGGGFIVRACVARWLKTDGRDGKGGGRRAELRDQREMGGRRGEGFGGESVEERVDTCCSTGAHIACANFVCVGPADIVCTNTTRK